MRYHDLQKAIFFTLSLTLLTVSTTSAAAVSQVQLWQYLFKKHQFPVPKMGRSLRDFKAEFHDRGKSSTAIANRISGKEYFARWDDISTINHALRKKFPSFDNKAQAIDSISRDFPFLTRNYVSRNFQSMRTLYVDAYRSQLFSLLVEHLENSPPLLKKDARSKTKAKCQKSYQKVNHTRREFWVLLARPLLIQGAKKATDLAFQWTAKRFPKMATYLDRGDAFRHAAWSTLLCTENARLTLSTADCLSFSKEFSDAHEIGSLEECGDFLGDPRDDPMDFHNNRIGREYIRSVAKTHDWNASFEIFFDKRNRPISIPNHDDLQHGLLTISSRSKPFSELIHLTWSDRKNELAYFSKDPGGPENRYCGASFESPNCHEIELDGGPVTIGVIQHNEACQHGKVSFKLDNENRHNRSYGISLPAGIKLSRRKDTSISFCLEPLATENNRAVAKNYDYIVLRMSNSCPASSYAFRRHIDNEDSRNHNSTESTVGSIEPSTSGADTNFEFCFIPRQIESEFSSKPWSQHSGVFANPGTANSAQLTTGKLFTDDENRLNQNSFYWYSTPVDIQQRILRIIYGQKNSSFQTVY